MRQEPTLLGMTEQLRGGRASVYLEGGDIVVTGAPAKSDDEEKGHNCDAMGCAQEHVVLRVPRSVKTLDEQLRKLGELAIAVDDIDDEEMRACRRIWAAERDAGIEKCHCGVTSCEHTKRSTEAPEAARAELDAAWVAYREMAKRRDSLRVQTRQAVALARELRAKADTQPAPAEGTVMRDLGAAVLVALGDVRSSGAQVVQ